MIGFVLVFNRLLKGIGLVLAVLVLVNPFMSSSASASRSSHPNMKVRAGTSSNWCGYVAVSNLSSPADGFVNSVTGNWVVPTLLGNFSQDAYTATWVGMDGFSASDATVEQIGTESDWMSGEQINYVWFEFYPGPSQEIRGFTVHNGDSFEASVTYGGGGLFALYILDLTTGQQWSRSYFAVAKRESAEWVVEAPSLGSKVLPLANFGTLNFSNSQFKDNTDTTYAIDGRGSGTYDMFNLDDPNGGSAEPSGLVDSLYSRGPSGFSVTYTTFFVGVSPASVFLDIGQSQLFSANVSGGTPPYAYQWYQNGMYVSDANDSSWNFTAVSGGYFTVYVQVNDSLGMHVKSNTATVTVDIHDVAIMSVTPSKTVVGQGFDVNITVTAADLGTFPETFNVTVYANTTSVASDNVTLSSGNSTDLTFRWNTSGVAYGDYDINAYAWTDVGESKTTNNNGTGGLVTVSIPGDINGDFQVNLKDLVLFSQAYGSKPSSSKWNPNADINGDGVVDLIDLVITASHYG